MGRYSSYYSPPRRGYGGRGRSPPRGRYGGYKEHNSGSLLVRNIPMDCRPEDLRIPFERYGRIRDVYLPKDYYTGEPRGFGFLQFVDPLDASEAQYHMNGQIVCGRRISVAVALETRKRPEEMRSRGRVREDYGGRHSSYYGRSRSPSYSHSRSPRYHSSYRSRYRSRSYSPAPRQRSSYSTSPFSGDDRSRSPIDHALGRGHEMSPSRSYSPDYGARSGSAGYSLDEKHSYDERHDDWRSPRRNSRSTPGSRSRSSDSSKA